MKEYIQAAAYACHDSRRFTLIDTLSTHGYEIPVEHPLHPHKERFQCLFESTGDSAK
jgi:hypothetical protein